MNGNTEGSDGSACVAAVDTGCSGDTTCVAVDVDPDPIFLPGERRDFVWLRISSRLSGLALLEGTWSPIKTEVMSSLSADS